MKLLCLISVVVLIISCTEKKDSTDNEKDVRMEQIKTIPEFQTIIDSANVEGAILICNLEKDKFYSNHFDWAAKGHLPASTFKIANSIIALETKVMKDDSTLLKWNREQRAFRTWEQDLILRDAFHYSCVPCYQEVARNIGVNRMRAHLDEMDYGSMIFDSSNIDMFWLQGQSHISQFQQVDFLKRLYLSKLPITERTETIIKRMMVMEENDHYKLSGKTGLSNNDGISNGWFVGYAESQNNVHFFATNIEPKKGYDLTLFPGIRKEITFEALKQIGVIN